MPGKPSRSNPVTQERMDIVEHMLAQMMRHVQIEKACATKWGIGRVQARKYIALVYDEWAERAAANDTSKERHRLRATFQDLYTKAIAAGDLRAAVDSLDRLCRIDGAYQPQHLVVGATVTANIRMQQQTMTTAEKRAELEKLLKERAALLDGTPAGKVVAAVNAAHGINGSNGTNGANGANGKH